MIKMDIKRIKVVIEVNKIEKSCILHRLLDTFKHFQNTATKLYYLVG